MSLINELKRRNVFRVGIAYVVAAWVIAQVADLVLENIGAPQWVMQSILLLLAIGFFVSAIFAWAYELTPEGIKREKDVVRSESVTHQTAKRLDIVTRGLLILAIGILLADRFLFEHTDRVPAASTSETSELEAPSEASSTVGVTLKTESSIAVLPFVALSTDADDDYLGKGIAEELLNSLAQFPELKVAARTSAFSFGGKEVDLRDVGETLGVAHVLEGSVRRSGERLRVTAQLIRTEDGFHLWSETYERQFDDIFDIQDEIVAELSRELQFRLGVGAGAGRAAANNVDVRAYEEYLQGLDLWWQREYRLNRWNSVVAFRRATELDPGFADAWSAYGFALTMSSFSDDRLPDEERRAQAKLALQRAIDLDPENSRAVSGLAYFFFRDELNVTASRDLIRQALEIAPNDASTQYVAALLFWTTGELRAMNLAFDRALSLDPLNRTMQRVYFQTVSGIGRYADASDRVVMKAECAPGECNKDHLMAARFLLAGALVSSDIDEVRQLEEKLANALDSGLHADREVAFELSYIEMLQKFAGFVVDQNIDHSYWRSVDTLEPSIVGCGLIVASILAQVGEDERALELLTSLQDMNILRNNECFYPLMPGRFQMPEHIRQDSRYHDFWSSPGIQALAEARRANGQTAGLPLPSTTN